VTILPKVRDWHALKADEEELERTQNDPNRFSARGGAMLREEKLRKRVGILLPRVSPNAVNWKRDCMNQELTGRLRRNCSTRCRSGRRRAARLSWSKGSGSSTTVYEAREAKEEAKEAKKVSTAVDRAQAALIFSEPRWVRDRPRRSKLDLRSMQLGTGIERLSQSRSTYAHPIRHSHV
jgi:hypothetical protein